MEIRSTTAIALVQTGDARSAFREQTVTLPELGTHQVLVETEAFGLNYAEVMARVVDCTTMRRNCRRC